MITRIATYNDYGRPATPGWRGRDWSAYERDALVARRRLHYFDAGTGDPAFVLVHGMGGRLPRALRLRPSGATL